MNPLTNSLLTLAGWLNPLYGAALWLAVCAGLVYRAVVRGGK